MVSVNNWSELTRRLTIAGADGAIGLPTPERKGELAERARIVAAMRVREQALIDEAHKPERDRAAIAALRHQAHGVRTAADDIEAGRL